MPALQLLRDVLLFRDVLFVEDGEVDGVVLASKLTAAGYRVAVRQALGGGSGVQVFSNLRHSFLLVTAPPECTCAGNDFIVEVGQGAGGACVVFLDQAPERSTAVQCCSTGPCGVNHWGCSCHTFCLA